MAYAGAEEWRRQHGATSRGAGANGLSGLCGAAENGSLSHYAPDYLCLRAWEHGALVRAVFNGANSGLPFNCWHGTFASCWRWRRIASSGLEATLRHRRRA